MDFNIRHIYSFIFVRNEEGKEKGKFLLDITSLEPKNLGREDP
jgi:hypothetical protein